MSKDRRRRNYYDEAEEDKCDVRRQSAITLWTMLWSVLLLVSVYFQLSIVIIATAALILIASTGLLYVKYKDFYHDRDRGQRTLCMTISLYASLLLTLGCAYYYLQDSPMEPDIAAVFLFGFFFFAYTVYRSASRTMVVGNKRRRYRS